MSSPSKETIQVGALRVRFLIEAADSNESVSVFECFVPAASRMPAPHSHDAFEEIDRADEESFSSIVRIEETVDLGVDESIRIATEPDHLAW